METIGFSRTSRGFTLVELMIVMGIIAIGVAVAVPTFDSVRNKRAVTNAAEQWASFLSIAQSEAIKRNSNITVTFDDSGANWCAGMSDTLHSGSGCKCLPAESGDSAYCAITGLDATDDSALVLAGEDFDNVASPVAASGGTAASRILITFDPVRGVLDSTNTTSGTVTFNSENSDYTMTVGINVTGRIDLCSPSSKKVSGYKDCS